LEQVSKEIGSSNYTRVSLNQANAINAKFLWHRRFGHPSREVLVYLPHSFRINCDSNKDKEKVYEICLHTKQTPNQFPISKRNAKDIFDLINYDVYVTAYPAVVMAIAVMHAYFFFLFLFSFHFSFSLPIAPLSLHNDPLSPVALHYPLHFSSKFNHFSFFSTLFTHSFMFHKFTIFPSHSPNLYTPIFLSLKIRPTLSIFRAFHHHFPSLHTLHYYLHQSPSSLANFSLLNFTPIEA